MAFGRLERSAGPQPMSDINVTPLVDVMLVLVVILIITAPLLASAIRLDLPKAESARPRAASTSVTVVVDARGQAHVADQAVEDEALRRVLTQAAARDPATELQLRADAGVPYGRVVALIGLAQASGLSRIGFVADPPAATPGR